VVVELELEVEEVIVVVLHYQWHQERHLAALIQAESQLTDGMGEFVNSYSALCCRASAESH